MKVRLKPAPAYAEAYSNPLFQFHEGPIKTGGVGPYARLVRCFNSMKVRLKLEGRGAALRRSRFQFHEGPIKT